MPNKILLVEDDVSVCEMLKNYLVREGFYVTTASNGEEGVGKFFSSSFDLVILDIMMPKMNGMEVMGAIREKSSVPILIMSARDGEADKAIGLGLGADDYIPKPFSLVEVSARINAAIRRATKYNRDFEKQNPGVVAYQDLTIDPDNFSAVKNEEKIQLTLKEYEILKLFLTHQNKVFTRSQIYSLIWKEDYLGDENVINVHMRRLREKIEDDASNPKYIKTLWGIGYKLGGVE